MCAQWGAQGGAAMEKLRTIKMWKNNCEKRAREQRKTEVKFFILNYTFLIDKKISLKKKIKKSIKKKNDKITEVKG